MQTLQSKNSLNQRNNNGWNQRQMHQPKSSCNDTKWIIIFWMQILDVSV